MTTSLHYTLVTPRADYTGPCNVAVDIGRAALDAGHRVSLLYLSGENVRTDLGGFAEARRWRLGDVFSARGIVHTHCLRPDLVGWLHSWNPSCRVITTLHNHFRIDLAFDHPAWLVRIAYAAWSRALARFDARVCVSDTMRRYYRRTLPHLSFEVAYNFRSDGSARPSVLDERLDAWLRSQAETGRTLMAYVGSLSPRKNLRRLVDFVATSPTHAVVLCGSGPERATLERQIAESEAGGRIVLAGQVGAPELVLARCHLLVLPSLAEGLPLVALEALRAGRPCLLSNIAVHRELARAGLGVTFDRHGFSDFAEKAALLVRTHASLGHPDARLTELYRSSFSAEAGYARYARLLALATAGNTTA
jgi:glycosyltransferase involved in cell wall biosynthesis